MGRKLPTIREGLAVLGTCTEQLERSLTYYVYLAEW